MNVLRWGVNIMENTSPIGLVLAGTVLAMASPPVRKGVRSAAVMATRGLLTAAGAVQTTIAAFRENMKDVVAEAQTPADFSSGTAPDSCTLAKAAKSHGRRLAVTAAAGALAVRDGLHGIVEEAKSGQAVIPEDSPAPAGEESQGRRTARASGDEPSVSRNHDRLEPDGPEAGTVAIGSEPPSRKRSRSKL
jgi:hypothetical protein